MNFTSNQKKIALLIFVIIIIFVLFKTSEGFVTNTEAINNISSMYNAANLTATNISATNISATNISATGDSRVGNKLFANNIEAGGLTLSYGPSKWAIQPYIQGAETATPAHLLAIAPIKADGSMDVYNNIVLNGTTPSIWTNKDIMTERNISANGNITASGSIIASGGIIAGGGQVPPIYVVQHIPADWKAFGEYAATKFNRSEPDLVIKKFIFICWGSSNTYTLTYYKAGNDIVLVQDGSGVGLASTPNIHLFNIP